MSRIVRWKAIEISEVIEQEAPNCVMKEVPEAVSFDISVNHSRRVFEALEETGHIRREGLARGTSWIVREIPPEDSDYWERFPSEREVKAQRRNFLRRNSSEPDAQEWHDPTFVDVTEYLE